MKKYAFFYSLVLILSVTVTSCSKKYGCYYSAAPRYENCEEQTQDFFEKINQQDSDCVRVSN